MLLLLPAHSRCKQSDAGVGAPTFSAMARKAKVSNSHTSCTSGVEDAPTVTSSSHGTCSGPHKCVATGTHVATLAAQACQ